MIRPDERWPEVGRALAGAESRAEEPARPTGLHRTARPPQPTLGNLTLVAGSLNPALSRSPWEVKKAELLKCSQPGLSRELHTVEDWAEREILARGEVLGEVACGVWRYPEGKVSPA